MQFLRQQRHRILAVLVGSIGIIGLLLRPHLSGHRFDVDVSFDPLHTTRLLTVLLSLTLLYVSFQLWNRKYRAWMIAMGTLTLLLVLSLLRARYTRGFVFGGTLYLLWQARQSFSIKSDNLNLRRGVRTAIVILLVTLLYGAIGFYLLERRDFGINFSAKDSLAYAISQLTFQTSYLPTPRTEYARLFISSLHVLGLAGFVLAVTSLFKPLRFLALLSSQDREGARKIIEEYSDSTEDFFKLYPTDKHYFFSADNSAVIAYTVSHSVALVIDGPAGDPKSHAGIMDDFTEFVEAQGWIPAIIHADEHTRSLAKTDDFKSLYIGSEALINTEHFMAEVARNKHFRYIQNKAVREELSVEHWPAPLTDHQIKMLRHISDAWIAQGKREYTFIMGYFDNEYLKHSDVSVLLQNNKPVAYVNMIPTFVPNQRSIDHMRHTRHMPQIGMHYLLKEVITRFAEQGVTTFNLGLAPLSKLDELETKNVPEKILQLVKTVGSRYYSFKGLEQFKNKFEPEWQARYICYKGPVTNLFTVTNALNTVVTIPSTQRRQFRQTAVLVLAIVAALGYASFPLGYILHLNNHGLVSELGAVGAPDADTFNALDMVSGASILIVALLLRQTARFKHRIMTIVFYALAGLGDLLAALMPLQREDLAFHSIDITSALHGLASTLNVTGLFVAAFGTAFFIKDKHRLLQYLFWIYVVISILSVVAHTTSMGPLVQRLQITLSGIWICLIPLVVLHTRNRHGA